MRGAKVFSSAVKPGEKKEAKKLFFKPSAIVAMLFLGVTALALAYIAGVMSGRHGVDPVTPEIGDLAAKEEKPSDSPGILAPEELEFARELRGQASRKNIEVAAEAEETKASPDNPVLENRENAVPGADSPVAMPGMFDFLVQIAAFKDEAGADSLRQKLEGYGYRTILQKSGNLRVVLVKMRAPENGLLELQDICRQMKLGDTLIKMKKPIAN